MDPRVLVVNRGHHGCLLVDGGRPLAWYPNLASALELARLLADASALRHGPPVQVEVHDHGRPPRRIPGDG